MNVHSPGPLRSAAGLWVVLVVPVASSLDGQSLDIWGFYGDVGHQTLLTDEVLFKRPLPAAWKPAIPLANYTQPHRPLYLDGYLAGATMGQDTTAGFGLERPALAFYAGHGKPESFSTPDLDENEVFVDGVRAGDLDLRYFWLHSCNVLAHGAEQANRDYGRPDLAALASGASSQNVFDRWRSAVGSGLRLVCGGSTNIGYVHAGEVWDYLLTRGTTVADAWVLGLQQPEQVPVCLAAGGPAPADSPLGDRTLLTEARPPEDTTRAETALPLHLQLPVACEVRLDGDQIKAICGGPSAPPPAATPQALVGRLPLLVPRLCPPPPNWSVGPPLPDGFVELSSPAGRSWKYHPGSAALILRKRNDFYEPLACGAQHTWSVDLEGLLRGVGVEPDQLGIRTAQLPTALEMRTETSADGGVTRSCTTRSLFLTFPVDKEIDATAYPVFGPTQLIEIQEQTSGTAVASLSALCRRDYKPTVMVDLITPADAILTVRRNFGGGLVPAAIYPDAKVIWRLGYEQAPERCAQAFLRPTYELRFQPTQAGWPTVVSRVDARDSPPPVSDRDCSEWGPFPPPA